MNENVDKTSTLLNEIRQIIDAGLRLSYQQVNSVLLKTYWQVGRRIVEEEQHGKARAEYGAKLIDYLAKELSREYPKGFSARNLREYRQFYLYFSDLEIWHSRVPNLTWTHFRYLLRVPDENARYWYMRESSREMWSVRTLERNIGSQYFISTIFRHSNCERERSQFSSPTSNNFIKRFYLLYNQFVENCPQLVGKSKSGIFVAR